MNKQNSKLPFLGASFQLNQYPLILKNKEYLCYISKRDLNPSILSRTDFYNKLNVYETYNLHNKYYSEFFTNKLSIKPDKNNFSPDLYLQTKAFVKCFSEGSRILVNQNILKCVYIYYPFIRISLQNNYPMITYFCLLQFFNDEKVFFVFEELPDALEQKDYPNAYKFNFQDTRHSDFTSNDIYRYLADKELYSNQIVLNINYKLNTFILKEFSIPIDTLPTSKFIITRGKLPRTTNTHSEIYYQKEDTINIGIAKKNHIRYTISAIEILPNLIASEHSIKKFKTGISFYSEDLDYKSRLKIWAKVLNDFNEKYKINVAPDDQNLIDKILEHNSYTIKEILKDGAGIVGAFSGSFMKEQL